MLSKNHYLSKYFNTNFLQRKNGLNEKFQTLHIPVLNFNSVNLTKMLFLLEVLTKIFYFDRFFIFSSHCGFDKVF